MGYRQGGKAVGFGPNIGGSSPFYSEVGYSLGGRATAFFKLMSWVRAPVSSYKLDMAEFGRRAGLKIQLVFSQYESILIICRG
jgi:hypothetical protein